MVAVAVLVFRLIGDSETGKAQARANGLATAAASLCTSQSAAARADARTIGRSGLLLSRSNLRSRLAQFATQAGLARVVVSAGSHVLADVGDRAAVAPGLVTVKGATGGSPLTVSAAAITAAEYARDLGSSGSLGEAEADGTAVPAVALGQIDGTRRADGVITVSRGARPFTDDDRELLRSLAAQATLALRNVRLHFQVRRRAVTDELTGLANHGRLQVL